MAGRAEIEKECLPVCESTGLCWDQTSLFPRGDLGEIWPCPYNEMTTTDTDTDASSCTNRAAGCFQGGWPSPSSYLQNWLSSARVLYTSVISAVFGATR